MVLGNSSEVSQQEIEKHFEGVLFNGETVEKGYKVIRDIWLFTSHRLIILDIQGITGKKKDFTSMPYSKIQVYSVETSGILDRLVEMGINEGDSVVIYDFEFDYVP